MTAPAVSAPSPPPATPAAAGDRLRGRLMAQSLGRLLDHVRGARDVLPHLAALERGLHEGGAAVIASVPRAALAKLCSQLGSLPLPADDPPLHDLLTRLMDALEGGRRPPGAVPAPRPSPLFDRDDRPFDMERTVVIEEVSHSDFMKVANGQQTVPRSEP